MTYGKNNFYGKGITYEVEDIEDLRYQKDFSMWKPNANKVHNYLYFLNCNKMINIIIYFGIELLSLN